MSNTCPSSSHQLVAASIAFRRARRKFPKNLEFRSRSRYYHKEPKATSPRNVKLGFSSNKQIRNVKSNNLYLPNIWINDHPKTPDKFLKKDIKRRPESSCSCCQCHCKPHKDEAKEIDVEKLKNEKSGGDVRNSIEMKNNSYPDYVKLNFDTDRRKYFGKMHSDKKPSWIYKSKSPVGTKSYDKRSCGREMAAPSILSDRIKNLKNDPETQYDLLTSYETLRQDQDDFPGGFYDWENRNHPGLSIKTISRNGVASGGCSCFEQSSEITSRQESCLRPSFVKAQQLGRVYGKNFSKGCSRYVQRAKKYPRDSPLISTTLPVQEDQVVPIDHKDSVTILVEKFRDCAKIKDQDRRNCGEITEGRMRSLRDNDRMTCYGNKKSGGCRKNFQNISNDFRKMISRNPRSRANGMWRHTF